MTVRRVGPGAGRSTGTDGGGLRWVTASIRWRRAAEVRFKNDGQPTRKQTGPVASCRSRTLGNTYRPLDRPRLPKPTTADVKPHPPCALLPATSTSPLPPPHHCARVPPPTGAHSHVTICPSRTYTRSPPTRTHLNTVPATTTTAFRPLVALPRPTIVLPHTRARGTTRSTRTCITIAFLHVELSLVLSVCVLQSACTALCKRAYLCICLRTRRARVYTHPTRSKPLRRNLVPPTV